MVAGERIGVWRRLVGKGAALGNSWNGNERVLGAGSRTGSPGSWISGCFTHSVSLGVRNVLHCSFGATGVRMICAVQWQCNLLSALLCATKVLGGRFWIDCCDVLGSEFAALDCDLD